MPAPLASPVIDIAFGPDRSLYVLEHSTGPAFFGLPGRFLKVAPDGTRTTVIDGLIRPGSVAVGPDGALYVSNHGVSISTGEVLRIGLRRYPRRRLLNAYTVSDRSKERCGSGLTRTPETRIVASDRARSSPPVIALARLCKPEVTGSIRYAP